VQMNKGVQGGSYFVLNEPAQYLRRGGCISLQTRGGSQYHMMGGVPGWKAGGACMAGPEYISRIRAQQNLHQLLSNPSAAVERRALKSAAEVGGQGQHQQSLLHTRDGQGGRSGHDGSEAHLTPSGFGPKSPGWLATVCL
jgi:hypothetical protein